MGGVGLTALAAITLGLCLLGLIGAITAAVRRGAAAAGLGLVFACVALRQGGLLYADALPELGLSAGVLGELALLGITFGGLAALRALHLTTRERDRAEDLHWDSMEAVRVMSELAARPGATLHAKLATVLDLGAVRFDLDIGIAWREAADGDSEVIALRASGRGEHPDDLLERMLPRLRDAAKSARPVLLVDREHEPRVLFAAPIHIDGDGHGALAFAGSSRLEHRITATDKDLIGLMSQWLAVELERRTRPVTVAAELPVREPEPERRRLPRRNLDLNDSIRRIEPRLRRRVGADATLTIDLDADLGRVRSGRLSLSRLVESVVTAAARLAPTGRIRIETRRAEEGGESEDLTLCVSVAAEDVGAGAFDQIFAESESRDADDEALPLARIERLLRREGGDLSVSVEPGHRAVITAFLPALNPRGRSYAGAAP